MMTTMNVRVCSELTKAHKHHHGVTEAENKKKTSEDGVWRSTQLGEEAWVSTICGVVHKLKLNASCDRCCTPLQLLQLSKAPVASTTFAGQLLLLSTQVLHRAALCLVQVVPLPTSRACASHGNATLLCDTLVRSTLS